jgi:hypothetical protein
MNNNKNIKYTAIIFSKKKKILKDDVLISYFFENSLNETLV